MINLGLRRIRDLISRLQNPISGLKVFHVSGTNGKGSVCTYLESILSTRLKVGKFTSPHLATPNDAIRIGERNLSMKEYAELAQHVRCISDRHSINATEFEIQTAVAFLSFKNHNVDVGVVEVGLGGLEDATNILEPSNVLCAAITKVAIDHEAFLGSTLAAVAKHKAGIIKPGVPCVVDGSNDSEVLEVVENAARAVHAPLHVTSPEGSNFIEQNQEVAISALRCALPEFSGPEIEEGIAKSYWPGRLEWLDSRTLVDGAHNESAAVELRRYVDALGPQPIRWVVAFSKPADSLLKILVRPGDSVIATEFGAVEGMPWVSSQPADELAKIAGGITQQAGTVSDLNQLDEFDGLTIICGSLYLVGPYMKGRQRRHQ